LLVASAAPPAAAPAAPEGSVATVTLRAIHITESPTPVVIIEADGPLPVPEPGEASHPSRIFLDFAGVGTQPITVPAARTGLVTRVRAAEHSASPLTARVVIDLEAPAAYTLDVAARASGRITVSLTARRGGSNPDIGEAAPAVATGTKDSSRAHRAGNAQVTRYLRAVSPILHEFDSIRDVLQAIDRRSALEQDRLTAAASLLPHISDELDTLRPPDSLANAHDLLRSACSMSSTAIAQVQASPGQPIPWNASSAAAGALIMLGRAEAALKE
jgi:hypothetical protein